MNTFEPIWSRLCLALIVSAFQVTTFAGQGDVNANCNSTQMIQKFLAYRQAVANGTNTSEYFSLSAIAENMKLAPDDETVLLRRRLWADGTGRLLEHVTLGADPIQSICAKPDSGEPVRGALVFEVVNSALQFDVVKSLMQSEVGHSTVQDDDVKQLIAFVRDSKYLIVAVRDDGLAKFRFEKRLPQLKGWGLGTDRFVGNSFAVQGGAIADCNLQMKQHFLGYRQAVANGTNTSEYFSLSAIAKNMELAPNDEVVLLRQRRYAEMWRYIQEHITLGSDPIRIDCSKTDPGEPVSGALVFEVVKSTVPVEETTEQFEVFEEKNRTMSSGIKYLFISMRADGISNMSLEKRLP